MDKYRNKRVANMLNMTEKEFNKNITVFGKAKLQNDLLTGKYNDRFIVTEQYIPNSDKKHPKDMVECCICGDIIQRHNYSKHTKTNRHKTHVEINSRLINIIIGKRE